MLKYVFSPANLVDLSAILPYWIELIFSGSEDGSGGKLMMLRVLRLTRVFRVFKIGQYNEVFTLFARVASQSMPALGLMLFFIAIGCCLFGTLMWFCESGEWYAQGHPRLQSVGIYDRGAFLRHTGSLDAEDYEESPFVSIVHSFWYVIVTITTVGYGDHYPTSGLGKVVGAIAILGGIIVLAMPIGVLGANFSKEYYNVLDEKRRRQRLKQQLETIAAVEEEQDAALSSVIFTEASPSLSTEAAEVRETNCVRQRLLAEAQSLDKRWSDVLPQMYYPQMSLQLRQLVADLLTDASSPNSSFDVRPSMKEALCNSAPPQSCTSRPVISMSRLAELDRLGVRLHAVISSTTRVEDLAEFGLKEAHQVRRQWAHFADRCWEYILQCCTLEPPQEGPGLHELKAKLFTGESSETDKLKLVSKSPKMCSEPEEISLAPTACFDEAGALPSGPVVASTMVAEVAAPLPGLVLDAEEAAD